MRKQEFTIVAASTVLVILSMAMTTNRGSNELIEADGLRHYWESSNIIEKKIERPEKRACQLELVSEPLPEELPAVESLGEFKITAYCPCEQCCGVWATKRDGAVKGASGRVLVHGYSIAVDPSVIPYGSIVEINGREYRADDCGGSIKGNRIDVYMDSHDDAVEFGVRHEEVTR